VRAAERRAHAAGQRRRIAQRELEVELAWQRQAKELRKQAEAQAAVHRARADNGRALEAVSRFQAMRVTESADAEEAEAQQRADAIAVRWRAVRACATEEDASSAALEAARAEERAEQRAVGDRLMQPPWEDILLVLPCPLVGPPMGYAEGRDPCAGQGGPRHAHGSPPKPEEGLAQARPGDVSSVAGMAGAWAGARPGSEPGAVGVAEAAPPSMMAASLSPRSLLASLRERCRSAGVDWSISDSAEDLELRLIVREAKQSNHLDLRRHEGGRAGAR